MASEAWGRHPDSGGIKVPPAVQQRIDQRIRRYAQKHFAGKYTRLEVRFRAQFCYIDAYVEPSVPEGWPPEDGGETREQYTEGLRNTPIHLCRLRYFGDEDRWCFAFFTYSSRKYELSFLPSGDFFGTPEDAFAVAAEVYLGQQ